MFKNKHIIIALIVAPILALISYFAVDSVVSEKPHAAKENTSYPLAAKSNCRYDSGECTLENGDVSVLIKMEESSEYSSALHLQSTVPIDGAKVSVRPFEDQSPPLTLEQIDSDGLEWKLDLDRQPNENDQVLVVLLKADTMFYGEANAVFLTPPSTKPKR